SSIRHTRSTRDWSSDVCSSDLRTLVTRRRRFVCQSQAFDGPYRGVVVEDSLKGIQILVGGPTKGFDIVLAKGLDVGLESFNCPRSEERRVGEDGGKTT